MTQKTANVKKRTNKKSSASKPWFFKRRGSYLPQTWQGMLIYLVYCTYVIMVPLTWLYEGRDLWQFLTRVIPLELAAAAATQYIAAVHSRER